MWKAFGLKQKCHFFIDIVKFYSYWKKLGNTVGAKKVSISLVEL